MRVPLPLVIFSCLAVVGGTWWHGRRNTDFLTPPSESKLADIRMRVESSLPPADHPGDAVSVPPEIRNAPPPALPETLKPVIKPGDFTRPPSLYEYADLAQNGSNYLIDLAVMLEAEGQFQRALIAWERVIDTGKPDESQSSAAITAIKRLRPTLPDWNTDPSQAIPITLHAGTGENTAPILTPILEEAARDLERASAGILKITATVAAGRGNLAASGSPPVALWLAGPTPKNRSTEVLSFTVDSPETLPQEVRKTVFRILRSYLARETPHPPPRSIADEVPPLEALNFHISRRSWLELGNLLNLPP